MTAPDGPADFRWVAVGTGRLALWHRPALRQIAVLKQSGCDHLITLLSEREGAATIGAAAKSAGLGWIWLPLPSSDIPTGTARDAVEERLIVISGLLDREASMILHCSAGIHRTGMIAYALLRLRGDTREVALERIGEMRGHTRDGLQHRHLVLGDELARTP